MMDTVVLTLEKSQFTITTPERFMPHADSILRPDYRARNQPHRKAVQNSTQADFVAGIYKPRLTLTERWVSGGYRIFLKIEFSAPKLLYGNNFDELSEDDFEMVLDVLEQRLNAMGVQTKYEYLKKAKISAIHYSKNVCMIDHATCTMVIQEIGKVNLGVTLDTNKTDYRNGGTALRSHANSHEIIVYDKKADMQAGARSEKRGLERDYAIQANLFDWGNYPKQLEVLRLEIRLCNRTKLRSLLRTLKLPDEATFDMLFRKQVSMQVIFHYWDRIHAAVPMLALGNFKPEDIFVAISAEHEHAKPLKILQLVGAYILNSSIGEKSMRSLILKHGDIRTWQRLKKEIKQPVLLTKMRYQAVNNVDLELRRFEPVKMRHLLQTKKPKREPKEKTSPPTTTHKPRRKTVKPKKKAVRAIKKKQQISFQSSLPI